MHSKISSKPADMPCSTTRTCTIKKLERSFKNFPLTNLILHEKSPGGSIMRNNQLVHSFAPVRYTDFQKIQSRRKSFDVNFFY